MSYIGIVFTAVLVISTVCPLSAQDCDLLQNADNARMIAYLRENSRSDAEAPCIRFAIRRLGDQRHVRAAIPVLIDYLDYKRPLNEGEKRGFFLHAPSTLEMYPAIGALFAIGTASVPYLLTVIESLDADQLKHQHAVYALMTIYRENSPEAIRLLNKLSASFAQSDVLKSDRLRKAAEEGTRLCFRQAVECENALREVPATPE